MYVQGHTRVNTYTGQLKEIKLSTFSKKLYNFEYRQIDEYKGYRWSY